MVVGWLRLEFGSRAIAIAWVLARRYGSWDIARYRYGIYMIMVEGTARCLDISRIRYTDSSIFDPSEWVLPAMVLKHNSPMSYTPTHLEYTPIDVAILAVFSNSSNYNPYKVLYTRQPQYIQQETFEHNSHQPAIR